MSSGFAEQPTHARRHALLRASTLGPDTVRTGCAHPPPPPTHTCARARHQGPTAHSLNQAARTPFLACSPPSPPPHLLWPFVRLAGRPAPPPSGPGLGARPRAWRPRAARMPPCSSSPAPPRPAVAAARRVERRPAHRRCRCTDRLARQTHRSSLQGGGIEVVAASSMAFRGSPSTRACPSSRQRSSHGTCSLGKITLMCTRTRRLTAHAVVHDSATDDVALVPVVLAVELAVATGGRPCGCGGPQARTGVGAMAQAQRRGPDPRPGSQGSLHTHRAHRCRRCSHSSRH